MMRFVLFFVFVGVMSGCAFFKPAPLDPKSGEFKTFSSLGEDEVKVNKPLAGIKNLPFVYIRVVALNHAAELNHFVRDSFQKIGFPKLVTEQDMVQLVIKSGLTKDVQSVREMLPLNRLSQVIGPYLIAEFRFVPINSAHAVYHLDANMIDPVSAQPVFSATRERTSWLDFDKEFSYPMMNAIKRWFDESAKLPVPEIIERDSEKKI